MKIQGGAVGGVRQSASSMPRAVAGVRHLLGLSPAPFPPPLLYPPGVRVLTAAVELRADVDLPTEEELRRELVEACARIGVTRRGSP